MNRLSFVTFKGLWVTALVVILDYLTKQWASSSFEYGQSLEVLPIFDLTLLHNTGAAFSFLADAGGWQRWFFTFIAFSVSAVLLVWMSRLSPKQRWLNVALALILGGALGNLYDRLAYGYVVDFLHFHWQQHYFPAFNIADSAITLGAIMLIIDAFWLQSEKTSSDQHAESEPTQAPEQPTTTHPSSKEHSRDR